MRESVLVSSLLCLLISLSSIACDKNVVQPSRVGAPADPAPPTNVLPKPGETLWDLTITLTAVDGPDNCFSQSSRSSLGWSGASILAVSRSGDMVSFDHDVRNRPIDNTVETGTMVGRDFKAQSDIQAISFPNCADGTVLKGIVQALVSGNFSEDGNQLVGNEQTVYGFSTGTITLHVAWSATRR